MSVLIPNLGELRNALHDGIDANQIAAAFDTDDLPAARAALRDLLAIWEQQAGEVAARALAEGMA